jgi:TIR domain-containing protein
MADENADPSRKPYDAFISYAGEDRSFAGKLAEVLRDRTLRVWYDRFILKVGDPLLATIDAGLKDSTYGILIVSHAYLSKPWPQYELDVLMRQYIETDKRILPVWHGISKAGLDDAYPGLSGIYAADSKLGLDVVADELMRVLVPDAASVASTSVWEDPMYRFLSGIGEATLQKGGAFTLWQAVLDFQPDQFPIRINDRTFTRDELIDYAYGNLIGDVGFQKQRWIGGRYKELLAVLTEAGYDLTLLAYPDDLPQA